MSVYTEIETSKLAQLCSQFGISMTSVTPIVEGVQNSNWFIHTDKQDYVLTLYEAKTKQEVTKLTMLVNALVNSNLPIALPLQHESGMYQTLFQGKVVQITPRLEGIHPEETDALMCQSMGESLAILHEHLSLLEPQKYALKFVDWEESRDQHMQKLPFDDKKLMYKVWQKYQASLVAVGKELPDGLIHADLFFDNTLWQEDNLTGLLDFTEVCMDYLLMDIAITANDFCTNWQDYEETGDISFDEDKLDYFLQGYNQYRTLSDAERTALPVFLAMAATRFWLFRLNMIDKNTAENRGGDLVKVKQPDLMKALAAFHLNKL